MASTITTCVIFLPVVFMQTITGVLFQELALVVAFSLACSLLVALTLVPMLTSKFMTVTPDTDKNTKKKSRFQVMFTRFENSYKEFLKKAIERKYFVFVSSVVLMYLSVYCIIYIYFKIATVMT